MGREFPMRSVVYLVLVFLNWGSITAFGELDKGPDVKLAAGVTVFGYIIIVTWGFLTGLVFYKSVKDIANYIREGA